MDGTIALPQVAYEILPFLFMEKKKSLREWSEFTDALYLRTPSNSLCEPFRISLWQHSSGVNKRVLP